MTAEKMVCPNCEKDEVGTYTADDSFLYGVENPVRLVAKDVLFFRCMACELVYTGEDGEIKRQKAVDDYLAARSSKPLVEQLHDMLHRDQTSLAAGLERVLTTVSGFRWATESRGCYEWDDDRFHGEMKNMLDAVQKAAQDALDAWKRGPLPCCVAERSAPETSKPRCWWPECKETTEEAMVSAVNCALKPPLKASGSPPSSMDYGGVGQVGCERDDGTLNLHGVNETCEVCAPEKTEAPHHEYCDTLDPIIKGKPCNCRNRTVPRCAVIETDKDHRPLRKQEFVHGVNCQEAHHQPNTSGYLHESGDNEPYLVDGVKYCGRCHEYMGE